MDLAARYRSSTPQVGRWTDLAKGIGRHWTFVSRVRCRGNEIARVPSIFAGRWLTLRQNGSGVSAAESEETKKMDFPTPPHTPLAGPNQGTKRPHTHKLKLALGYSHDIKAIQAKSSTFNKITQGALSISRV